MAEDFNLSELEALFEEVRSLPLVERAAVLDQRSADRPALRREVEELLALEPSSIEYFDRLERDLAVGSMAEVEQFAQPRIRVGAYRAHELIGRGGMGVVYRAERTDGSFEQEVALKLLHLDLASPEMQARFLAERQLLARLDHPNIARLLDGGVTQEGRPFFVMEKVDGLPIDLYSQRQRLPLVDTLLLFQQVIEAVSYLHRHLVVHRDLKPSNILVTEDGRVKLLDFGIAKMIQGAGEDFSREGLTLFSRTQRTATGEQLLTPDYAAPEQLAGAAITTATDVYSLGAVLYQLLTGEKVRAVGKTAQGVFGGIEVDAIPDAPSAVLRRRAGEGREASARWTTLSGDLDAICLKALRPEPDVRYASAAELGADLQRFLADEPVAAREASRRYLATRFVRRNWRWLAAAVMIVVIGASLWWRERTLRQQADDASSLASIEAEKAREVSEFLADLLASAKPEVEQGRTLTVGEVVEKAVARLEGANAPDLQPDVEARLRQTLGETLLELGRHYEALPLLESAFALSGGLGDLRPETLAIGEALAQALAAVNRAEEAEPLMLHVYGARAEELAKDDPVFLRTTNRLGTILWSLGRLEELETLDREVLAQRRKLLGDEHPDTLQSLNALGGTLFNRGRFAEAAELYREALPRRRRIDGPRHPATLALMSNLAATEVELGNYREALPLLEEALAGRLAVLGPDHRQTATTYHNLGWILLKLGRFSEAKEALLIAAGIRRRSYDIPEGEINRAELASMSLHAEALRDEGDLAEAERQLEQVLAAQLVDTDENFFDHQRTRLSLATLLLRRADEGRNDLQAAHGHLELLTADPGPEAGQVPAGSEAAWLAWARLAIAEGRPDEALHIAEAVGASELFDQLSRHHPLVLDRLEVMVLAYLDMGSFLPAVSSAREIYTARSELLGQEHRLVEQARRLLATAEGGNSK